MSAASLLDQQQGLSKFIASAAGSIGLQVPPASPGGASVGSASSARALQPSQAFSSALGGGMNFLGGSSLQGAGTSAGSLLSQMQLAQASAGLANNPLGVGGMANLGAMTANMNNSALLQQHLAANGLSGSSNGGNPAFAANLLQLMQQQQRGGSSHGQGAGPHNDNSLNQIQQRIARQLSQDNFNSQQSLRSVASALAGRVSPGLNGMTPMHSGASSFNSLVSLQQQIQAQQQQKHDIATDYRASDLLDKKEDAPSRKRLRSGGVGDGDNNNINSNDGDRKPIDMTVPLSRDSGSTTDNTTNPKKKRSRGGSGQFEFFAQLNDPDGSKSGLRGNLKRHLSGSKISSAAALTSVLQSDTEFEHSDQDEQDLGNFSDAGSLSGGHAHLDDDGDDDASPDGGGSSSKKKRSARLPTPPSRTGKSGAPVAQNNNAGNSNNFDTSSILRDPMSSVVETHEGAKLDSHKVAAALQYYQTQNNAILKRAMIHAKFDVLEIDDSSPVFHAFSLQALDAEHKRLVELKNKAQAMAGPCLMDRLNGQANALQHILNPQQGMELYALAQRLNRSNGQHGSG
jgi:hypothetical protein